MRFRCPCRYYYIRFIVIVIVTAVQYHVQCILNYTVVLAFTASTRRTVRSCTAVTNADTTATSIVNSINNNKKYNITKSTLITFDVDGTLLCESGQSADTSAHSRSFAYAVEQVFLQKRNDHNLTTRTTTTTTKIQPVAEALPRELYHGSTDGLILLRLVNATLGIGSTESFPYLHDMMNSMYQYISNLSDHEIANSIQPLPGVIDTLQQLASIMKSNNSSNNYNNIIIDDDQQQPTIPNTNSTNVMCGLVTGNVEGIARRKMKATGIYDTGVLSPLLLQQLQPVVPVSDPLQPKHRNTTTYTSSNNSTRQWDGTEQIAFLGGFGSDYCSGNIQNISYNYIDRGVQIEIAVRRCQQQLLLLSHQQQQRQSNTTTSNDITHGTTINNNNNKIPIQQHLLQRVVHVGDAPADVLASKNFAEKVVAVQQRRQKQQQRILLTVNNNNNTGTNFYNSIDDNDFLLSSIQEVRMIATATGSYSALLANNADNNNNDDDDDIALSSIWKCIVLEKGIADPNFLQYCLADFECKNVKY